MSGQHRAVHRLRSAVRQAPTHNQINWGSPDKAVVICAASAVQFTEQSAALSEQSVCHEQERIASVHPRTAQGRHTPSPRQRQSLM